MPKRAPTTELNHDNWDQEDSDEEIGPGAMPVATDEQLKKRVIIAAKRRSTGNSNSSEKKLFSSFSGFNTIKKPATEENKMATSLFTTSNKFGVLESLETEPPSTSDKEKTDKTKTNVGLPSFLSDVGKSAQNSGGFFDGSSLIKNSNGSAAVNGCSSKETTATPKHSDSSHKHKQHRHLCKHLKVLNEGVLNWTQTHLKTNPYLDLRPIFDDYIKHYESLEKKFGSSTETDVGQKMNENGLKMEEKKTFFQQPPFVDQKISNDNNKVSFGRSEKPTGEETAPLKFPTFNFGQKNDVESGKTFSFTNNTVSTSSPSFSFGATTTSQVPTTTESEKTNDTEKHNDNDEGEYHPPEVECVQVEEKDAFFTIKCKLFYKSGQQFRERGVGTLYLKPYDNKVQLLVRADTSLGNILLNVAVSNSMHCTRTGKNNVSFFCVPHPSEPKCYPADTPVMFLVRVKTSENADELYEKMTKVFS